MREFEDDLYIVKIWYEVEPGFDTTAGPVAAEEIFEVVANSPDQAKEYARMQWDGPIDRIEIVDVNPEYDDEQVPFEACDSITSAEVLEERKMSQASFDFAHDGYYSEDDIDRCIRLAFEDAEVTVEETSYHDVDYSDYPEYDDVSVSQVDVDFSWETDYNSDFIEYRLEQELAAIGYELIGIDFRSLN